jgi:hypothetical protein
VTGGTGQIDIHSIAVSCVPNSHLSVYAGAIYRSISDRECSARPQCDAARRPSAAAAL